jgi:hypothetical protein
MTNSKKSYIGLVFKILFIGVLIYVGIYIYLNKKAVLDNPYQTTATITGFKNCYKNGRCIEYTYEYNGIKYSDYANSDWNFSNWCERKNDCIGFEFKITLDKENPKNHTADWEEIFKNKEFINYP